jgi:hypothetical protein
VALNLEIAAPYAQLVLTPTLHLFLSSKSLLCQDDSQDLMELLAFMHEASRPLLVRFRMPGARIQTNSPDDEFEVLLLWVV